MAGMEHVLGVVGLGYVGLTSGCAFASLGHRVVGYDIDAGRVARLCAGELPIFEPGLSELLTEGLDAGRLEFSTDPSAISEATVVFLCLPTPEGPSGIPDTSILKRAFADLAAELQPGAVVVTKSTVPIGTAAIVPTWTSRDDLRFASNPEFLREGSAVKDFLEPDRVVIGAIDAAAGEAVAALYGEVDTELIVCDPVSAELIKYASNAFLATKLSFVNEMARICDHLGGDIGAVTHGLGTDHRISDSFLAPGPGWGGSCFPKDVAGLASFARTSRLRVPVIESAGVSNRDHLDHVFNRMLDLLDGVADPSVAVWGLAFKANTDDVRSSPAVELIERLNAAHIAVRAHDPVASVDEALVTQTDRLGACAEADLLVVATEWPEFGEVDWKAVAKSMRRPVVFDLRNVVDRDAASAAGVVLSRIGRVAPEA